MVIVSFILVKASILALYFNVCSDSIILREQLEELQIRLVTLEKKTGDYESIQAELEEKRVDFFFLCLKEFIQYIPV